MLHRISPEDVEIGMFVHAFEGSWFDHPFWRRNFRISSLDEVMRIRNSRIEGLVIDTERGDIAPETPSPVAPPLRGGKGSGRRRGAAPTAPSLALRYDAGEPLLPPPAPPREATLRRTGYRAERRRAQKLVERSSKAVLDMFEDARLGRAVTARRMVPLARAIGTSIERDAKALLNLVRLKRKDEYTYLHSVAVAALMMNFARHLDLDAAAVQDLGVAGLLHDVGKVAVPGTVLNKQGSLSEREWQSVRAHPLAGHRLLSQSPDVPAAALEVCLRHHEKLDGTGYPGNMEGEAVSLFARLGAICDVYDAITSDRPYKRAWTPVEALTEMQKWSGHFDSRLLDRFADSLGIFPTGTLVRLSTSELGVVVESGGETNEGVVVRVFFDCETLNECEPFDRLVVPADEHPRILYRDSPTFWRFADWTAIKYRVLGARAGGDAG